MVNRLLDLGVGVKDDPARGVVAQPDRQWPRQLAPAGFGEDSSPKPCLEHVELRSLIVPFRPRRRRSLNEVGL